MNLEKNLSQEKSQKLLNNLKSTEDQAQSFPTERANCS